MLGTLRHIVAQCLVQSLQPCLSQNVDSMTHSLKMSWLAATQLPQYLTSYRLA